VKFNQEQKSILIGMILGDAYLQKTGAKNARLRLEHGIKQKEYLIWKISKFPNLFQGKPKYIERKHPINSRVYKYWRHQSNSTPELGRWHAIFYKDGRKQIPKNLQDFLKDPISLAVWYMDDGYYYERDKVSYLYLGRVTREEAEIVSKTLQSNFKINSKILNKKKKGFVLYFSPQETIKFHEKIKKFILSLFVYKISEHSGRSF